MTLQNTRPLRFSPVGLSDTLAEEDAFPGSCALLQDLIPDPSTKNLWTPRPASIELTSHFTGFSSPTGVPVYKIVGSYVFGLVSTALHSGKDQPFCFNLLTNTFVSVTGITSSNVPATQATTGDWTPPTMDVMGNFVIVTHPGFDGVTNFIGWFDITTLTAPVWNAGNFTLVTPLVTASIAFAGTGYTNGTYTNIPLLDGTGAGATANITVSSNHVTAITIVKGGLGYNVGDTLTVNNALIGGGTGFVALAATVTGSGIQGIAIISPGINYTSGYYAATALTGGSGTGATANITVINGQVVGVQIVNAGSGYLVNDYLTVGGAITALGSITGGTGYTTGTYASIGLQNGSGFGAVANITVNGSGHVSAVTLVNGGEGYLAGDSLTVTGGTITSYAMTDAGGPLGIPDGIYPNEAQVSTSGVGRGALFTLVVSGGVVISATMTNPGQNYAANDTINLSPTIITVFTVSTATPIGPGTGFAVAVSTVTATTIGAGGNFFLAQVITLTTPGGYINFTTIPSWVRQFNGRAWFGINPSTGIPSVIFSDVYALNCTNANQALSFGDNTPLTAAAPLGLANLLGGVIQSLIVFKSLNGIIQITGDSTTNNLSVNQIPGGSGTISPRSVVEHPQGLLYADHDGIRMVTLDGNCTDPIGSAGQGVVVPFLNPTSPTRMAAGCNGSVLRISVLTSASVWQEYWFDLVRKVWSGPHSFPATIYDTYEANFIVAAETAPVGLWQAAFTPTPTSTYTENGVALSWEIQTSVLMDNMQMAQSEIAEMQVKTSAPSGITSIVVDAIDQDGNVLATETYTFPGVAGIAAWPIDFSGPVVYNRLAINISGVSATGVQVGDIYVRARTLGYRSALF